MQSMLAYPRRCGHPILHEIVDAYIRTCVRAGHPHQSIHGMPWGQAMHVDSTTGSRIANDALQMATLLCRRIWSYNVFYTCAIATQLAGRNCTGSLQSHTTLRACSSSGGITPPNVERKP